MAITFEQAQPMAPGISEGAGALSQYEQDRRFAMLQREQAAREQQQAFQQQLDVGKFQQSQVQPFQLQQQHVELQMQAQAAELTMAERLRMQRLQQGLAWVDQNGPTESGGTGLLNAEEVNAHRMQLQTGLSPYQQRQQQASLLHSQAETATLNFQRSRLTNMDEEDRAFRARSLEDRIVRRPNPMAGIWAQIFPNAEPLPDLEHVEQANGTFLPMNDAANQAAIAAAINLHAAQAQNLQAPPNRAITPQDTIRINHEIEAALDRRHEGLERGIREAATAAQRDIAQQALDRFVEGRPAERARRLQDALAVVNQNAGNRPEGAGGQPPGIPVPGAHPAFTQNDQADFDRWAEAARRIAPPTETNLGSAGRRATHASYMPSPLMRDVTRAGALMRQYGRIGNMPPAEQTEFVGIQQRLRDAGVVSAPAAREQNGFAGGTF